MNRSILKSVLFVLVPAVFAMLSACDKEQEPEPAPAAKTLNKATLTPKKWYTQGSSTIHDFKANGVYGDMGGTWQWVGNSDTMDIVTKSGFPSVKWKIFYNTDTEMSAENTDNKVTQLFKDKPW